MERSKYISYHKGRSPRMPKAKVMAGSFEDRNKYYRCWQCGFPFNIEQTQIGGDGKGSYLSAAEVSASDVANTGDKACVLGMWTPFLIGGIVKRDGAGEVTQQPATVYAHSVSIGCPLCGTVSQF